MSVRLVRCLQRGRELVVGKRRSRRQNLVNLRFLLRPQQGREPIVEWRRNLGKYCSTGRVGALGKRCDLSPSVGREKKLAWIRSPAALVESRALLESCDRIEMISHPVYIAFLLFERRKDKLAVLS